jgi:hypothetical protein
MTRNNALGVQAHDQAREIAEAARRGHCAGSVRWHSERGPFPAASQAWVYYLANFAVVRVQWKRSQDIVLTLRGIPSEFDALEELPLCRARAI